MLFDPVTASVRFGYGLSPVVAPPASVDAMLTALGGPDAVARALPIPGDDAVTPTLATLRALSTARNEARDTDGAEAAEEAFQSGRRAMQATLARLTRVTIARAATAEDALRERLVRFWADHFTVRSRNGLSRHLVTPFVETAIRPHVTGRFADMLRAVTLHPMMLHYLDQRFSMGPGSRAAQQRDRGLNENLARELLELHTVGVDGPYVQADVRELAELLTGLSFHPMRGMEYRPQFAEPGAETVLGVTYGAQAELSVVTAALEDLAVHPATTRHLAWKLARHFVADDAPPDLVAALEAAFGAGGGLMDVYAVLLDHPDAWVQEPRKVKPPFDFVASSLRALAVPVERLLAMSLQDTRRHLLTPMAAMGQPWQQPPGPDGWPEVAEAWVTPQGMAARIEWAMRVPGVAVDLPDPRDFVQLALGEDADPRVVFAAEAAETVSDGVGLVLASAAFQRR